MMWWVGEGGKSEGRPVMGRIGIEPTDPRPYHPTRKRADFHLVFRHERTWQTVSGGKADESKDRPCLCGLPCRKHATALSAYREGNTGKHSLVKPRPSAGRSQRLEPDEAKVSRPVLRGGGGGNAASLPEVRREVA
jgi:hypothetical protein